MEVYGSIAETNPQTMILMLHMQTRNHLNFDEILQKIQKTDGADEIIKNVEITVPLRYIISVWKGLEITSVDCETELELDLTRDCEMSNNAGDAKPDVIHARLNVPIIFLSIQDNIKLLQQLSIGQKTIYTLL